MLEGLAGGGEGMSREWVWLASQWSVSGLCWWVWWGGGDMSGCRTRMWRMSRVDIIKGVGCGLG